MTATRYFVIEVSVDDEWSDERDSISAADWIHSTLCAAAGGPSTLWSIDSTEPGGEPGIPTRPEGYAAWHNQPPRAGGETQ